MSLLELSDVTRKYNEEDSDARTVVALKDIDLAIERGEFISIIGPSGCGKSTMLEVISGIQQPTGGRLRIDGKAYSGVHDDIGFVFQEESTFPWKTTMENTTFGLKMNGIPKEECRQKSQKIIDMVGLSGFEDSYPGQLSGGMKQRVAIARTLVMDPDIMLMDEPFGALDEQTRLKLGEELLRIWRETNKTIMFVTHDIDEAIQLGDRVVVMTSDGGIQRIVNVDIPRPRDASITTTKQFNEIASEIWEDLRTESEKSMQTEDPEVAGTRW